MSAEVWYVLTCDSDGCDASFTAELPRAWETRNAAKKHGWTCVVPERAVRIGPVKSLDLCERHSKEQP